MSTKTTSTSLGFTGAPALSDIEKFCARYEDESAELENLLADLNADLEAVKRKHLAALKRKAATVAQREAGLRALVESAPHLFEKPRTQILHGVKVGFASSAGRLEYDDAKEVVALIERHLKSRRAELVQDVPTLNKVAIKRLTAVELAKIGCRIEGAGDSVVVQRVAGEVEKLIENLIGKLVEAMVETEETPAK